MSDPVFYPVTPNLLTQIAACQHEPNTGHLWFAGVVELRLVISDQGGAAKWALGRVDVEDPPPGFTLTATAYAELAGATPQLDGSGAPTGLYLATIGGVATVRALWATDAGAATPGEVPPPPPPP